MGKTRYFSEFYGFCCCETTFCSIKQTSELLLRTAERIVRSRTEAANLPLTSDQQWNARASAANGCALCGAPGLTCRRLQTAENIQHRGRCIGMVMDDLPNSGFALINVRNAMLDAGQLPSQRDLPMLYTHFVSHLPRRPNELLFQFNLAA